MKYKFSKITKITPKPFKGTEGDEINYFWIKAETTDGEMIEYGTKRDDYAMDDVDFEVELEKMARYDSEGKQKGFRFKEIV